MLSLYEAKIHQQWVEEQVKQCTVPVVYKEKGILSRIAGLGKRLNRTHRAHKKI